MKNKMAEDSKNISIFRVQIDKDVPLPISKRNPVSKQILEKMEIDDSFFIPKSELLMATKNVPSTIHCWGRRMERKFVVRHMPDGMRVWRVK